MQTWLIMMGLQMIIFVICGVWVGIWMHRSNDEYDDALDRLTQANIEAVKNEQ